MSIRLRWLATRSISRGAVYTFVLIGTASVAAIILLNEVATSSSWLLLLEVGEGRQDVLRGGIGWLLGCVV